MATHIFWKILDDYTLSVLEKNYVYDEKYKCSHIFLHVWYEVSKCFHCFIEHQFYPGNFVIHIHSSTQTPRGII